MLQNLLKIENLPKNLDATDGLAAAVCHFYNEGKLSKKFSYLVQRDFLYNIALEINLESYLEFNKQKSPNISVNKSILDDSFESLIGSIFVDGGYQKA